MNKSKIRRRRYFIHPSVQIKYIGMSIIPALLISVFCIYFLIHVGDFMLRRGEHKLNLEASSINQTLQQLQTRRYPRELAEKIIQVNKDFQSFQSTLNETYYDTLKGWNETKKSALWVVCLILICVGIMSLLYSHRIAGPIYRIRQCIDMMSEGKDIPPIKLRTYDEFKEVAASLNKLREKLKEKES